MSARTSRSRCSGSLQPPIAVIFLSIPSLATKPFPLGVSSRSFRSATRTLHFALNCDTGSVALRTHLGPRRRIANWVFWPAFTAQCSRSAPGIFSLSRCIPTQTLALTSIRSPWKLATVHAGPRTEHKVQSSPAPTSLRLSSHKPISRAYFCCSLPGISPRAS